jgi:hypothetical protein
MFQKKIPHACAICWSDSVPTKSLRGSRSSSCAARSAVRMILTRERPLDSAKMRLSDLLLAILIVPLACLLFLQSRTLISGVVIVSTGTGTKCAGNHRHVQGGRFWKNRKLLRWFKNPQKASLVITSATNVGISKASVYKQNLLPFANDTPMLFVAEKEICVNGTFFPRVAAGDSVALKQASFTNAEVFRLGQLFNKRNGTYQFLDDSGTLPIISKSEC